MPAASTWPSPYSDTLDEAFRAALSGKHGFDRLERRIRWELWSRTSAAPPTWWKFWRSETASLHPGWLELCDSSGFVRERFLRELKRAPKGAMFWILALRRLNDWVPQVRAAARTRLPILALEADSQEVAEAMWITLQLWRSWGRMGPEEVDTAVQILSLGDVATQVKHSLMERTTGRAAAVLSELGRWSIFDSWYPELALSSVQPSVRAKSYRTLFEHRASWLTGHTWRWTMKQWGVGRREAAFSERRLSIPAASLELLDAALKDKSSTVRKVAGDCVINHKEELHTRLPELAASLAADRNHGVRLKGLYLLELLQKMPGISV